MKIIDEHLYALEIPITIFYLWLKYTHCKNRKWLQHTILSQYSHIVYGLVCAVLKIVEVLQHTHCYTRTIIGLGQR